jgi:ABC-type multidrug transport system fused ATPase/permease subunit
MFFAMIFEAIGLGSLIPLINYYTDASLIPGIDKYIETTSKNFNFSKEKVLNLILILVIAIFLIKNLYMVLFHWIESRIVVFFKAGVGVRLFDKYLHKNYDYHINKNSSELASNIIQETAIFGNVFLFISTLFTEIFLMLGVVIIIGYINPIITILLVFLISSLSIVFYKIFKKKIDELGNKRKIKEREKQKDLQEGLSSIKDIIIYQAQSFFVNRFENKSLNVASLAQKFSFISKLPKLWFETFGVLIAILIIGLFKMQNYENIEILASLSILIISLIKILPSINKTINSLQYLAFAKPAINNLYEELMNNDYEKNNKKTNTPFTFKNEIKFKNVFFKYSASSRYILNDINFNVKKNEVVGIIGETGSGKSTLINLIIGLMKNTSGKIDIDNIDINNINDSWIKNIGYVPQTLQLIDDSILNNIAFGIEYQNIDFAKIEKILEIVQLNNFISRQKNSYNTFVGESGVKISGGERQRIGIARALYKNPEIIIFDEATSAIDVETEKRIFTEILKLKNKTIIFITHRKSSTFICDKVFSLSNNRLLKI